MLEKRCTTFSRNSQWKHETRAQKGKIDKWRHYHKSCGSTHTVLSLKLIMLNVNEYPPFPPRPYYTISWPGFWFHAREYLLPVNKQENRVCHVSLGLPHLSLICENMYPGQRFQAFPWDPVGPQSSSVRTCKQTLKRHTVSSEDCTLEGEQRSTRTQRARLDLPSFLRVRLTNQYGSNGTTLKTKESLGNALVIHHLLAFA